MDVGSHRATGFLVTFQASGLSLTFTFVFCYARRSWALAAVSGPGSAAVSVHVPPLSTLSTADWPEVTTCSVTQ